MEHPLRPALLIGLTEIRAGILEAEREGPVAHRLDRFCDALIAWARIPAPGRDFYGKDLVEVLFNLAADIEESAEHTFWERTVLELSFWDVALEVQLIDVDPSRTEFVSKRQTRLLRLLEGEADRDVERLLLKWASLLRPRVGPVRQLPGLFREPLAGLIAELLNAGLPRRAKAIANKFQMPLDPLVAWTINNRPESQEVERTRGLLARIELPPRPIPYGIVVSARALSRVVSAPLGAIPIIVSGSGNITIGSEVFGLAPHRTPR
jgi:hypothetical protein